MIWHNQSFFQLPREIKIRDPRTQRSNATCIFKSICTFLAESKFGKRMQYRCLRKLFSTKNDLHSPQYHSILYVLILSQTRKLKNACTAHKIPDLNAIPFHSQTNMRNITFRENRLDIRNEIRDKGMARIFGCFL